ncbi:MAG: PilZ domain-containing protein [Sulfuricellaceae bacterium]|nr:PilZ domain-containing protein [Sulfuricellaceae bacterium]
MSQSDSIDLRRFARVDFRAPVQLDFRRGEYSGHLLDIALKGALVETPAPLEAQHGEICRLTLPLGTGGEEKIVMEGKVAYAHGRRIGIECYLINLDSVTRLRRLIELNLGDPDLLEREFPHLHKQWKQDSIES